MENNIYNRNNYFNWLLLGFLPLPDGTLPAFDRAPNNWSKYIDLNVLGEQMRWANYDPEDLLSTIPWIVTCISAVLIGKCLDHFKSITFLIIVAFILLASGAVFNIWFPINKAI